MTDVQKDDCSKIGFIEYMYLQYIRQIDRQGRQARKKKKTNRIADRKYTVSCKKSGQNSQNKESL